MKNRNVTGFTLIELVITIVILGILLTVVISAINPATYLARARDNERKAHLISILNVVGQRTADNRGAFETGCAAGAIPATATKMAVGGGNYDIAPCLVPTYLASLTFDPNAIGSHWTSISDYDTGYTILKDAATRRVTISAPGAELETVSYTR